ncbi:hypothetical protein [Chroococcidiopsis sp.]|uniref:hypothetical protein n=1 Tax=Chroococcidiopsis sp. TaxID=3088168 RepID=UPI003F3A9685
MKTSFCINAYGMRIPCRRDDLSSQKLAKTLAFQHQCIDFTWSEEGNTTLCAYVEFPSLERAIAYGVAITRLKSPQNYIQAKSGGQRTLSAELRELVEKRVYVRMNGGSLVGLYSEPEKRIKFRLQSIVGGKTEVKTPLGRIDLLTDIEIVEVKPFKDWKAAIGQVLVYGSFYPNHKKRIHLFDRQEQKTLNLIQEACAKYDIQVTFEIDKGWQ